MGGKKAIRRPQKKQSFCGGAEKSAGAPITLPSVKFILAVCKFDVCSMRSDDPI